MILLRRLDGSELVINVDHLLSVEKTPDTVITLTTGARLMVRESVDDIIQRAIEYHQQIHRQIRVIDSTSPQEEEET
jgi:flagellar protein FlbD